MESDNKSISRRTNLFIVSLLALSCCIFFSWYFNPGFMSVDSLSQYRQAAGLQSINDAHPVIMVYLWRGLLNITGFIGSMLLFHQFIYWLSLLLLVTQLTRSLAARLIFLLVIGLWPPLIITSLHVWKDVGMMSALVLCVAALLGYSNHAHWGWITVALIALLYAISVRINGFIPGVILLLFLSFHFSKKLTQSFGRLWALTLTYTFIALIAMGAITSLIKHKTVRIYSTGTLLIWDMASISIAENKNLLPDYLPRINPQRDMFSYLQERYSPNVNTTTFEVVSPYIEKKEQSALFHDWLTLVLAHPGDYLQHRLYVFTRLLGADREPVYNPYQPGNRAEYMGITFTHISTEDVRKLLNIFDTFTSSIIYRAWLYTLLAIIVLLISVRRVLNRDDPKGRCELAIAVSLSGLVNTASLFFIATAADFRYMVWSLCSALIATLILLNGRQQSKQKGSPE